MLPPYPGTLPKGTSQISARNLSVGDLIFLDSAASGTPVRSLIIQIRGSRFMVMNGLNPEPYEVVLPHNKMVWAVKHKPRRSIEELHRDDAGPAPRESSSKRTFRAQEPEDYRACWSWDKNDKRAQEEFYAVEDREWRRLREWWETKKAKNAKTKKKVPPPKRRIDSKVLGWYKLLDVKVGSSLKELRSAYKQAAFRYHPDRCKDVGAEEMFKRISEAYGGLLPIVERKTR